MVFQRLFSARCITNLRWLTRHDVPDLYDPTLDDAPNDNDVHRDGPVCKGQCVSRMDDDQFLPDGRGRDRFDPKRAVGFLGNRFEEGAEGSEQKPMREQERGVRKPWQVRKRLHVSNNTDWL